MRSWIRIGMLASPACLMVLLAPSPASSAESAKPDFRQQEADAAVEPLVPKVPATEEERKKADALSWYMTGRLLETRADQRRAFQAYQKSLALDPDLLDTYRALVPLSFRLNLIEDAVRYAQRAVELDPNDVEMLQQLATHLANKQEFPEAIKYLEQAANSERLEKKSPAYILLMRSLGILYSVLGDKEKAADAYSAVFVGLRDHAEYGLDFRTRRALLSDQQTTFERIGEVLLDGGKVALAGEAFDLAEKSGRVSEGNLYFHRARVQLLSDKPDAALEQLQTYLDGQRQSKGRAAYELLAEILKKLGRESELLDRLKTLADKDARNKLLQYFYAEKLAEAMNLEEAKAVYERSLAGAGDAQGYLGLASVLRQLKQPNELIDALGAALSRVSPESAQQQEAELRAAAGDKSLLASLFDAGRAQATAEPSTLTFEEAYILGKLASEGEEVDVSAEFFRKALPLAKERKFLIYGELAEIYQDAGRHADASAVYEEALKEPSLAERRPDLLMALAQSREMGGETDAAIKAIEEALKIVPGNPQLRFREAWIYYHAHRWDEAIPKFESIVADHPEFRENPLLKSVIRACQYSISNIYVQKGDMARGEKILEVILAEEPNDPSVNNDLGYLYADQGKNLEQAESMIRKAVTAEPDNAAYLDSLGWVLFKQGKAAEALPYLEKSIEKSTGAGDATLQDHLGDCLLALGRVQDAVAAWEKALADARKQRFPDQKLIDSLEAKLKEHAKK
ncbi:MAG: tetratricopeptide repeat protein [Planctomycetaceae bacterium]|nr:tetratricopeptide repeat protein [Planctomycetaceae bacterium]